MQQENKNTFLTNDISYHSTLHSSTQLESRGRNRVRVHFTNGPIAVKLVADDVLIINKLRGLHERACKLTLVHSVCLLVIRAATLCKLTARITTPNQYRQL